MQKSFYAFGPHEKWSESNFGHAKSRARAKKVCPYLFAITYKRWLIKRGSGYRWNIIITSL